MNYFSPNEFLCKCGRPECDAPKAPSPLLVELLNVLRERYGHPITVTSGMRCAYWNAHEGGKSDSGHLTAEEADIACPNSAVRWNLFRAIYLTGAPLFPRIGVGKNFLHLGVSERLPRNVIWHYYPKEK